jgi:hypothetical protein
MPSMSFSCPHIPGFATQACIEHITDTILLLVTEGTGELAEKNVSA